MLKIIILNILCFFISVSCDQKARSINPVGLSNLVEKQQFSVDISYDYNSPLVLYLDSKLMEVSGLAFNKKDDLLIAHNDEKGDVYELNTSDGSIRNIINFSNAGDYESIEFLEGDYVVGESNGDLHFYNKETTELNSVDVKLSSKNDVEGMCLDPANGRLLLACKGQPKGSSKSKKKKVVYSYDINSGSLINDPFLEISDEDIVKVVNESNSSTSKSKLKKLIKRAIGFSPSGIAVQPISMEYYIISAKGSTLLIIDQSKKLREVVFLNDKVNKQPEGITFDAEGNMYIATEGRGMRARIFKYKKTT